MSPPRRSDKKFPSLREAAQQLNYAVLVDREDGSVIARTPEGKLVRLLWAEGRTEIEDYGTPVFARAEKAWRNNHDREALALFRELADLDDPQALNRLGEIYDRSPKVARKVDRAARYYRKAAQAGHAAAAAALARMYKNGTGVKKNLNKAAELYRQAARGGHHAAAHHYYRLIQASRKIPADPLPVFKLLWAAARAGDAKAQQDLSEFYESGRGIPKNRQQAEAWWAAQVSGPDKLAIAGDHALGRLGGRDRPRAAWWYRLALEDEEAGIRQRAREALESAPKPMAARGPLRRPAPEPASETEPQSGPEQNQPRERKPERHLQMAFDLFRAHAERLWHANASRQEAEKAIALCEEACLDDPDALQWIAARLRYEDGTLDDPGRAVGYFERAVEAGSTKALVDLGDLYMAGKGVKADADRALQYYEQAAQKGDALGLAQAAEAYISGEKTPQDPDHAVDLYRRFAQSNPYAAYEGLHDIAMQFWHGRILPRDRSCAVALLDEILPFADRYSAKDDDYILVARACMRGRGLPRNPAMARVLLEFVVETGLTESVDKARRLLRKIDRQQAKGGFSTLRGLLADLKEAKAWIGRKFRHVYWEDVRDFCLPWTGFGIIVLVVAGLLAVAAEAYEWEIAGEIAEIAAFGGFALLVLSLLAAAAAWLVGRVLTKIRWSHVVFVAGAGLIIWTGSFAWKWVANWQTLRDRAVSGTAKLVAIAGTAETCRPVTLAQSPAQSLPDLAGVPAKRPLIGKGIGRPVYLAGLPALESIHREGRLPGLQLVGLRQYQYGGSMLNSLSDLDLSLKSTLPTIKTPRLINPPREAIEVAPSRPVRPSRPAVSATERVRRGLDLIKRGRYRRGIEILRPYRDRYPAARQGLIYAQIRIGAYQAAIDELKPAREYAGRRQNLIFAYLKLAEEHLGRDKTEKAIAAYRGLKAYARDAAVSRLYELGRQLFEGRRYELAILAYQAIGRDDYAYELTAQAEFALERIDDAFASLDKLDDGKRRRLLKGDFLRSIGAYPLAVEHYGAYRRDPNVAAVMKGLKDQGLDRFRIVGSGSPKWRAYQALQNGPDGEIRTFMFRVLNGQPRPSPVFQLSHYPPPAVDTFSRIWYALKRLDWPKTGDGRRLHLTVVLPGSMQTAAIWDSTPPREEIIKALDWATVAARDFRYGERHYETGDNHNAMVCFVKAAGRTGIWTDSADGRPHYAALGNALKTLVDQPAAGTSLYGREEYREAIRRLLYRHYPLWEPLSWATTLAENGETATARSLLDDIVSDWPERYAALERSADIEWFEVGRSRGADRGQAFERVQIALTQLLKRRPHDAQARIKQFKVYRLLGANALAARALAGPGAVTGNPEVGALREFLTAVHQLDFKRIGSFKGTSSGLTFEVYENTEGPPGDGTLAHHSAEIAVRDDRGVLIETFAVTSQAFDSGSPRHYFLDRIGPAGELTLAHYGPDRPDPLALTRELIKR